MEAKVKNQNSSGQPLQGVAVSYKTEENEYELSVSNYAGYFFVQLFAGTYQKTGLDHTFILDGTHQNEETLTVKLLSSDGKA